MWWTAITLAGVAAWFEWTYRRNHKPAAEEKSAAELPETPAEEPVEQARD